MQRWIEVKDGIVKGSVIESDNPKFKPVDVPKCGIVYVELTEGQEVPVARSTYTDGVFTAPVAQEPVEPTYTQEQWDAIRQQKIMAIEAEAQTKLAELAAAKAGATQEEIEAIPVVKTIREIRAADWPGSELPI